jgi:hypothetical protein
MDDDGELTLERETEVDLGPEEGIPLPRLLAGLLFAVGLGLASGFILANVRSGEAGGGGANLQAAIPESGVKKGQVFGLPDKETFRDKAVGVLEVNEDGPQAEGTHKLIRDPDNPSQNAYLISSVVDLDKLVGRKVEVFGETLYSEKVGWLMDVGRVKVLD